jgi:predicted nucleic acid-binding protein
MPAKVIDASVVGAMAFQETRHAEAAALIQGSELYAPTLLPYELCNTACKKARLHPESKEDLIRGLRFAPAIDFHWISPDQEEVMSIAFGKGISAYDASYLYVAHLLGAPLVTFDKRLAAAARG